MKFTVDKQEKYCVFALNEEKLNSVNAPMMKSEMIVLNAEGWHNIIIDLSSVKFVDSSGLSAILIANRLCKNAKGSMVLMGVMENVEKLVKISQLDNILPIVRSRQEAIDYVLMEQLERDLRGE
jgi:anti-sigma B factor antagonist